MRGFWYSIKENLEFTRAERYSLFWTTLAFAFIQALIQPGAKFEIMVAVERFLFFLFLVGLIMFIHVLVQKMVAIKLGYKATYTHWTNGLYISVLIALVLFPFMDAFYKNSSFFVVSFLFILPGSVMITHIPKLRLGKFRFGTNQKDIARVSLAGPLSHVLMLMIAGIFYFATDKNPAIYAFILINVFLAFYSILPIPKLDSPGKMDAGSDGLGMFYFSRSLYLWALLVIILYVGLILTATIFSFILAFIAGSIFLLVFNAVMKQSN